MSVRENRRATSGDFATTGGTCLENNSTDPRSWQPEDPGAGDAWFFLIRAVSERCGFGSYDSGFPTQQSLRDARGDAVCP